MYCVFAGLVPVRRMTSNRPLRSADCQFDVHWWKSTQLDSVEPIGNSIGVLHRLGVNVWTSSACHQQTRRTQFELSSWFL